MSFLDDVDDCLLFDIVIKVPGTVTSADDNTGQPARSAGAVTVYDDKGTFYLLSATEVLAADRRNNPSTHGLIIDPGKATGTITEAATAIVDGVTYTLYSGENILKLGDVGFYTAAVGLA